MKNKKLFGSAFLVVALALSFGVAQAETTNTAPVLANIASPITIPELSAFSFDANATDSDVPAQTLTFSLKDAPAGATINPSTGIFNWTPTESQGPRTYTFKIRVSDGSLRDSQSVKIRVTEVENTDGDQPDDKKECKKGGWKNFSNPKFKNQGNCVSFVNKLNKNNHEDKKGKNSGVADSISELQALLEDDFSDAEIDNLEESIEDMLDILGPDAEFEVRLKNGEIKIKFDADTDDDNDDDDDDDDEDEDDDD